MDDISIKIHGGDAFDLKENFDRLAAAWRRDTEFFSWVSDIVLDPSYQQIIGLGPAAVPLILEALQKKSDHWYWALAAITQADPAKNAPPGDMKAIRDAWLDWGNQHGFIK